MLIESGSGAVVHQQQQQSIAASDAQAVRMAQIELLQNLTTVYAISANKDTTTTTEELRSRDPLHVVIPISVIYITIFFTGLIGNVATCVVIARNRSMHTATNYYLFSLAVSDLLLLLSGLPPEMYYIWSNYPYVFGEVFCVIQSFAAETSANATVLTITAFTVERYVAICHPFLSHTMSKLSRAIRYVIGIWLLALCLAVPQAIQFGIIYPGLANGTANEASATCSLKWTFIDHAFEISTILLFVVPMSVITVLYILIGLKLRNSSVLTVVKRNPSTGQQQTFSNLDNARGKTAAQRNVIRMLVAVVVAFFICWAPFHAQRLLAVYAQNNKSDESKIAMVLPIYSALTYVSGVFYYLSTTINPLLYNIMSNKFREAFKAMLSKHCGRRLQKASPLRPNHSSFTRYPRTSTLHRNTDPSLSLSEETQRLANCASDADNNLKAGHHVIGRNSYSYLNDNGSNDDGTNTMTTNEQLRQCDQLLRVKPIHLVSYHRDNGLNNHHHRHQNANTVI